MQITPTPGAHRGGLLSISSADINAAMKDISKSPRNKKDKDRKKKSKGKDKNEITLKRRASALNDPDYDRQIPLDAKGNGNDMDIDNNEQDDDDENDGNDEDEDDGADMSEQVANILMVQPQRTQVQGSDTLFFSNLGLLGSHSNDNFATSNNLVTTQDLIHNTEGYDDDDDMDDVVVFRPAFSRNDFSMSPSIPMDPEPYLPFANKHYHGFNSTGSLDGKWDVKADTSDYHLWGNDATDFLNGILDDNDVGLAPSSVLAPPGLAPQVLKPPGLPPPGIIKYLHY